MKKTLNKINLKRKGNLYNQIISIDNLELSDRKAQKGKSKQFGVIKHNKDKDLNILKLSGILENKTYKTSKYSIFIIKEPKLRK